MQVDAFAQPGERAATCLVECLSFPHDGFEPVRQEGADRPPFLSRDHPRLTEQIGVQFERHIRLHDEYRVARQCVPHSLTCSTVMR